MTAAKPRRVVVVDDTLRQTLAVIAGGKLMLQMDRQRRKIQKTVNVDRVLEGRHLEHALRRARRWMRKPHGRAPRHIAVFLAALHKTCPAEFAASALQVREMKENAHGK
jgi:uncharacterized protein YaiI (UPF0178 family)